MTVGHGSTQESVTFPDSPASDSTSLVLPVQSDPQGKGKSWIFLVCWKLYENEFHANLVLWDFFPENSFHAILEVFISHNNWLYYKFSNDFRDSEIHAIEKKSH